MTSRGWRLRVLGIQRHQQMAERVNRVLRFFHSNRNNRKCKSSEFPKGLTSRDKVNFPQEVYKRIKPCTSIVSIKAVVKHCREFVKELVKKINSQENFPPKNKLNTLLLSPLLEVFPEKFNGIKQSKKLLFSYAKSVSFLLDSFLNLKNKIIISLFFTNVVEIERIEGV